MIRRVLRLLTAHIDSQLLVALMMLMTVGIITIFSGSNQSVPRISSQVANIVVALTVMYIFANVPPQHLKRIALPAAYR